MFGSLQVVCVCDGQPLGDTSRLEAVEPMSAHMRVDGMGGGLFQ